MNFGNGEVDCLPWEPDDKGGGFPCIEVNVCLYTEKELDSLIKKLLSKRPWLRNQINRLEGKTK